MEKYNDEIMGYVRQHLGLEEDDTSMDDVISEMGKEEVLDRVVTWNGLIGYGSTLKGWVEDIYEVELED